MQLRYVFALCPLILAQAGCYYRVIDPQTGAVYYTERWVAADGYQGPLEFTDHSGRTVSLRASRVDRIGGDQYREAIDAELPAKSTNAASTAPAE